MLVTPHCASSRTFVSSLAVVATLALAGSAATDSYTIRRGDTLSGIAGRLGVPARSIVAANGLANPDRVIAGRTLQIPARGGGAQAPPALAATPDRLPSGLQAKPARLAYIPIFEHWAAHYGVPADLVMAMTWLESGWQEGAVSSAGAVGIGQLMPDTTVWMRDRLIGEPLDPHVADDNIRMSARYLQWLLDRTGGDVRLALGGYYQGLNAVRARGLLPETERYVAAIIALRDRHF